ncbi:MAG: phosphomannose isomerase type II C-terminal cupin domain [Cyanobacteriota bacterium]|nr:phosphomannose isomerase type II C-terminal cupin domain [Cyanobacteriota bacterium]
MSNEETNGTITTESDTPELGPPKVRPWGTVTILEQGERYRINRIEVNPGHHISTQMHYHRSEHWIVVSGTAKVIFDGQDRLLLPKQSTYVPMNTAHRVENPGVIPLVMIEVQNGEYLGEDDIIRFGDEEEEIETAER